MEGLWAHPSGRIPVASGGFAQTKAAYRLLENPVLEWREILEVHTQRTVERIAGQAVALCIQDTTALDFTSQPGIAGLGRLSYEAITWLVCPDVYKRQPQNHYMFFQKQNQNHYMFFQKQNAVHEL